MIAILGIGVIALFVNEIRKEFKRTEESNHFIANCFIANCFIKEFEKNENQA